MAIIIVRLNINQPYLSRTIFGISAELLLLYLIIPVLALDLFCMECCFLAFKWEFLFFFVKIGKKSLHRLDNRLYFYLLDKLFFFFISLSLYESKQHYTFDILLYPNLHRLKNRYSL